MLGYGLSAVTLPSEVTPLDGNFLGKRYGDVLFWTVSRMVATSTYRPKFYNWLATRRYFLEKRKLPVRTKTLLFVAGIFVVVIYLFVSLWQFNVFALPIKWWFNIFKLMYKHFYTFLPVTKVVDPAYLPALSAACTNKKVSWK